MPEQTTAPLPKKSRPFKRPDISKCNLAHIWFETEKGAKRPITDKEIRNGCFGPSPKKYPYACVRFPTTISTSIYRRNKHGAYGGKDKIVTMESGAPGDLAVALVINHSMRLDDALAIASTACERCMNILAYDNGLKWGYSHKSKEADKANTSCELCR